MKKRTPPLLFQQQTISALTNNNHHSSFPTSSNSHLTRKKSFSILTSSEKVLGALWSKLKNDFSPASQKDSFGPTHLPNRDSAESALVRVNEKSFEETFPSNTNKTPLYFPATNLEFIQKMTSTQRWYRRQFVQLHPVVNNKNNETNLLAGTTATPALVSSTEDIEEVIKLTCENAMLRLLLLPSPSSASSSNGEINDENHFSQQRTLKEDSITSAASKIVDILVATIDTPVFISPQAYLENVAPQLPSLLHCAVVRDLLVSRREQTWDLMLTANNVVGNHSMLSVSNEKNKNNQNCNSVLNLSTATQQGVVDEETLEQSFIRSVKYHHDDQHQPNTMEKESSTKMCDSVSKSIFHSCRVDLAPIVTKHALSDASVLTEEFENHLSSLMSQRLRQTENINFSPNLEASRWLNDRISSISSSLLPVNSSSDIDSELLSLLETATLAIRKNLIQSFLVVGREESRENFQFLFAALRLWSFWICDGIAVNQGDLAKTFELFSNQIGNLDNVVIIKEIATAWCKIGFFDVGINVLRDYYNNNHHEEMLSDVALEVLLCENLIKGQPLQSLKSAMSILESESKNGAVSLNQITKFSQAVVAVFDENQSSSSRSTVSKIANKILGKMVNLSESSELDSSLRFSLLCASRKWKEAFELYGKFAEDIDKNVKKYSPQLQLSLAGAPWSPIIKESLMKKFSNKNNAQNRFELASEIIKCSLAQNSVSAALKIILKQIDEILQNNHNSDEESLTIKNDLLKKCLDHPSIVQIFIEGKKKKKLQNSNYSTSDNSPVELLSQIIHELFFSDEELFISNFSISTLVSCGRYNDALKKISKNTERVDDADEKLLIERFMFIRDSVLNDSNGTDWNKIFKDFVNDREEMKMGLFSEKSSSGTANLALDELVSIFQQNNNNANQDPLMKIIQNSKYQQVLKLNHERWLNLVNSSESNENRLLDQFLFLPDSKTMSEQIISKYFLPSNEMVLKLTDVMRQKMIGRKTQIIVQVGEKVSVLFDPRETSMMPIAPWEPPVLNENNNNSNNEINDSPNNQQRNSSSTSLEEILKNLRNDKKIIDFNLLAKEFSSNYSSWVQNNNSQQEISKNVENFFSELPHSSKSLPSCFTQVSAVAAFANFLLTNQYWFALSGFLRFVRMELKMSLPLEFATLVVESCTSVFCSNEEKNHQQQNGVGEVFEEVMMMAQKTKQHGPRDDREKSHQILLDAEKEKSTKRASAQRLASRASHRSSSEDAFAALDFAIWCGEEAMKNRKCCSLKNSSTLFSTSCQPSQPALAQSAMWALASTILAKDDENENDEAKILLIKEQLWASLSKFPQPVVIPWNLFDKLIATLFDDNNVRISSIIGTSQRKFNHHYYGNSEPNNFIFSSSPANSRNIPSASNAKLSFVHQLLWQDSVKSKIFSSSPSHVILKLLLDLNASTKQKNFFVRRRILRKDFDLIFFVNEIIIPQIRTSVTISTIQDRKCLIRLFEESIRHSSDDEKEPEISSHLFSAKKRISSIPVTPSQTISSSSSLNKSSSNETKLGKTNCGESLDDFLSNTFVSPESTKQVADVSSTDFLLETKSSSSFLEILSNLPSFPMEPRTIFLFVETVIRLHHNQPRNLEAAATILENLTTTTTGNISLTARILSMSEEKRRFNLIAELKRRIPEKQEEGELLTIMNRRRFKLVP